MIVALRTLGSKRETLLITLYSILLCKPKELIMTVHGKLSFMQQKMIQLLQLNGIVVSCIFINLPYGLRGFCSFKLLEELYKRNCKEVLIIDDDILFLPKHLEKVKNYRGDAVTYLSRDVGVRVEDEWVKRVGYNKLIKSCLDPYFCFIRNFGRVKSKWSLGDWSIIKDFVSPIGFGFWSWMIKNSCESYVIVREGDVPYHFVKEDLYKGRRKVEWSEFDYYMIKILNCKDYDEVSNKCKIFNEEVKL